MRLQLSASLSTEALGKLKRERGTVQKPESKDFKSDYAKEQLRENMGPSETKGRDLKEEKRRL
jgi:hypothetical protein